MLKRALLCIAFVSCSGAQDVHVSQPTKSKQATQNEIDAAVNEYLLESSSAELNGSMSLLDHNEPCEEGQGSPNLGCVEIICKKLGTFGCDDQSEVLRVSQMCRGNRTGKCVETLCEKLGTFGCDDIGEIERVAQSCKGNFSQGCVAFACEKLGTFGCDDVSEVERVAAACKHNRGSECIAAVCSKLGTFGCDDISEIESVARSCGGN